MLKLFKSLVLLFSVFFIVKGQNFNILTTADNYLIPESTLDPFDYGNPTDEADLQEPLHVEIPFENGLDAINEVENEIIENPLDSFGEGIENVPQNFLLSWQARRTLRKILSQMPCGWPEYNFPPLAPYINEHFSFQMKNQFVESTTNVKPLRIDGLNNMEIHRLNVGIVLKRINFDFNFPNITFTGNFDTNTTINLQQLIGVRLFVKGDGKLNISLENFRISGSLKYKLPIFFGSAKISKLQTEVSVGNVRSELGGSINGIPIGGEINDLIVTNILKYLNEYNFFWSGLIERQLLPVINTELKGNTLWKLLLWSMSRNVDTCEPGALTNIDMEELHQLLLKRKPKAV